MTKNKKEASPMITAKNRLKLWSWVSFDISGLRRLLKSLWFALNKIR